MKLSSFLFGALGLLQLRRAGAQGCFNDGECGFLRFCKQVSATTNQKQCSDRAKLGESCKQSPPQPWDAKLCLDNYDCVPNALGQNATCQVRQLNYCNVDMDCRTDYFCRQVTAGSNLRQCYSRATLGTYCTVPNSGVASWLVIKCDGPMTCHAFDNNAPQLGGLCKLMGNVGCNNNDDCTPSQFCRPVSQLATYKTCVARSGLGGACTPATTKAEFESVECAKDMECLAIDQNNARLGGTCVMRTRGLEGATCQQNFDCGASHFCRRRDMFSNVKVCFLRGKTGELCTVPGTRAEWETRVCLDSLSCELRNPSDPAAGGQCTSQSRCKLDSDCAANAFCKQATQDSLFKECIPRVEPGGICSILGMVEEWKLAKCVNGYTCKNIDPANPNLGGQCNKITGDCVSDQDCGEGGFCKPVSADQRYSSRKCHSRADEGQFCIDSVFAPTWNQIKCVSNTKCVLAHESFPEKGGTCQGNTKCSHCESTPAPVCSNGVEYLNGCFARCAGIARWQEGPCGQQGCQSDKDCGTSSMFCKTAMPMSDQKTCFVKSQEGDLCTWAPYVHDWERKQCLDKLYCVLIDENNPPRGGTCQSQLTRCEKDTDCDSPDLFCKRMSRQSAFKSCVPRAVAGETCTLNNTVVEWDMRLCLNSLYCMPNNFFDVGLGGLCGGSEKCLDCPNYYSPVCGNGREFQNPCFAQCFGVYQYNLGACPMPAGSGPVLNTVNSISGAGVVSIPGHPYSIYTNNNPGSNSPMTFQHINEVFNTHQANNANFTNNYFNNYAGAVPARLTTPPVTVNYTNPYYNPYLPGGRNNDVVSSVTYNFPSVPLDPFSVTNYDQQNPFTPFIPNPTITNPYNGVSTMYNANTPGSNMASQSYYNQGVPQRQSFLYNYNTLPVPTQISPSSMNYNYNTPPARNYLNMYPPVYNSPVPTSSYPGPNPPFLQQQLASTSTYAPQQQNYPSQLFPFYSNQQPKQQPVYSNSNSNLAARQPSSPFYSNSNLVSTSAAPALLLEQTGTLDHAAACAALLESKAACATASAR
eukprot:CAMPEP_0175138002 /NCGR_PEP_ID=MMETSP0087-20121206/10110_1 /TAXON_ID=136419 /ORGANISM="Unknown Unknown, Strain D1" /LENGTH=1034 /DNA_ID=CAMNT_0016420863 /DNA_START=104 /DNA_END=3209 /DNA_ORIENTATION=-